MTDDECVCHGDFWPGNMLLGPQGLTLVDWEIVRRGCGVTDVAQFSAEAWLLDESKGGRGLLSAFLKSYTESIKVDRRFLQRAAVHFGIHIAFWPVQIGGRSKDELEELVRYGSELMQKAMDEDWDWLSKCPLGVLLQ